MLPFNMGAGGASSVDTGDIPASLRFRAAASAYLSRTPASAGNRRTWTWSGWVKRGALGSTQIIFQAGADGNNFLYGCYFNSSDKLVFSDGAQGGGSICARTTDAVFRDPTSWLHIVVQFNAAATSAKIYVNGVEQTATGTQPANVDYSISNTVEHRIGRAWGVNTSYLDGYLSRICFVDGSALTPSSFGYLNTEINEWVSKSQSAVKAVVDAGGTNSFMLDFDDATSLTTLGYDKSSKGNNWTLNNFSLTAGATYDRMLDVPGNSFATLNPVDLYGAFSLSAGNLHSSMGSAANGNTRLTLGCTAPTYVEYINNGLTAANTAFGIGIALTSKQISQCDGTGGQAGVYGFYASNVSWLANGAGANIGSGGPVVAGTIMQIAYDPVAQKMWVGKGNVWYDSSFGTTGNPSTGANPTFSGLSGEFAIYLNNYANNGDVMTGQAPLHASATYDAASGGYFRYTPPSGYKALCQRNMPDGESITTSGSFTGTLNADGPYIDIKGVPTAMTINGNAVTLGTHADKTSSGFKIRTASSSYNNTGSNTFSVTSTGAKRKYSLAQGNP